MQNNNKIFSFERIEDNLGALLWQASHTWQRMIRSELDLYDISHSQFVILATLMWFKLHNQDPNQVAIINLTKLDKMTVSKSLKKLAELKLITRLEDVEDTRAKKVFLTTQGEDLAQKLIPIVENIDKKFFTVLAEDEQNQLIKTFRKLVERK